MNNVTSNKMGVVKKCPNCGATVEMSMVRCPECGYHFGGVEANSSARKLAAMLNASKNEDEDKRSNIVVNFPVPTTKADLLEFMADLLYRAKHYDGLDKLKMASAFKAKFRECAIKAHIYFNNDPDFQHLFEIEADSKKFRWRNFSSFAKDIIVWLSLSAVLLAICAIVANWDDIKNYFRDNTELKELSVQVKEQVDKGDLKQAEFLLTQATMPSSSIYSHEYKNAASLLDNAFVIVVQYYIEKGDIKSAKRIGKLLEGKVDFLYDETMTYNILEQYEENGETSYHSQNSNSNEKKEVYNRNQVAKQTEEIANQIHSQVEDYTEEIRSQAEDYASQISSVIDNY